MLFIVVAAIGHGKTTLMRDWLLPTLMDKPRQLVDEEIPLPVGGYRIALIHDPPKNEGGRLVGQYPGRRYPDVAAFLRDRRKPAIACLEFPNMRAMMKAGLQLGRAGVGTILVFDELDRVFPYGPRYPEESDEFQLLERGRHCNVAIVGSARFPHALHKSVRANRMGVWVGAVDEPTEEAYCRKLLGLPRDFELSNFPRREFLEWRRGVAGLAQVTVIGGRRMVVGGSAHGQDRSRDRRSRPRGDRRLHLPEQQEHHPGEADRARGGLSHARPDAQADPEVPR